MKNGASLAVVGATGLLGTEIVSLIEEKVLPVSQLRLFGSSDSDGEYYSYKGSEISIEQIQNDSFSDVDIAIFCTPRSVTESLINTALAAGSTVIDCSGYLEAGASVELAMPSLIIPRVWQEGTLTQPIRKYRAPSPTTIMVAPFLAQISAQMLPQHGHLKRAILSTYQSVSGAGQVGLDELWSQSLSVFNQRQEPEREDAEQIFSSRIAYNLIPTIDLILDSGDSKEEVRVKDELRQSLNNPALPIGVTAVRVPLFHSYSVSVSVETSHPVNIEALYNDLQKHGLKLASEGDEVLTPLDIVGTEQIHIARLRPETAFTEGVKAWLMIDNILAGTALNTVETVRTLISHHSHQHLNPQ